MVGFAASLEGLGGREKETHGAVLVERHEGVQDMACDTFIKISIKCKSMFVVQQIGEVTPFVDSTITDMPGIINELQPHQARPRR
jgi:hypothetical protein